MSAPALPHMFVHADGELAEYLCHVELLGLTRSRAEVLHALHHGCRREDCLVIAATELHLS